MSGCSPNTDNLDSNYFKEILPIACSWKQPDYLLYLWNKGNTRRGMSPWKSHGRKAFKLHIIVGTEPWTLFELRSNVFKFFMFLFHKGWIRWFYWKKGQYISNWLNCLLWNEWNHWYCLNRDLWLPNLPSFIFSNGCIRWFDWNKALDISKWLY